MAEAYVGEVRLFSFNWAPDGWLLCQGQLLSVSQFQVLFTLLGTAYGGDGVNTFGLPDLRGRVPVQAGQGPLGLYQWPQKGGTSNTQVSGAGSVTITSMNQLPQHTHAASFTGTGATPFVAPAVKLNVSNDTATSAAPLANGYLSPLKAGGPGAAPLGYTATVNNGTTTLNTATAAVSGGAGGGITGGTVALAAAGAATPSSIPVPVVATLPATDRPFLVMNYAICIYGIYPPRP